MNLYKVRIACAVEFVTGEPPPGEVRECIRVMVIEVTEATAGDAAERVGKVLSELLRRPSYIDARYEDRGPVERKGAPR